MKPVSTLLVAGAVLFGVASPASAQKTEVLKRTAPWVVNYDDDACHLIGTFGEGKDSIYIRFTRYDVGDELMLTLIGKRLRTSDPYLPVELSFNDDEPVKLSAMAGEVASMPMVLITYLRLADRTDAPPFTPEQEAALTRITARVARQRPFTLVTGPLDKPMAAMRACARNLVESWGYDPDVQGALARPPEPVTDPASWIRDGDYPQQGISGGVSGLVRFRLDIDAEGAVKSCKPLARTEPDVFGKLTCNLIARRARFNPATDVTGVPVRSYYVNSVVWRIK